MDWVPVNFGLAKNPLNWFIVFFMVLLLQIPLILLHDRLMPHVSGGNVKDSPPPA